VSDRQLRIVLDASAIVAFTRASIDVGEVVAEVDDELAAFGLPALCLVQASGVAADPDRLEVLVNHRAVSLLDVDAADWRALAVVRESVGRLDAATAALAATDQGCHLLTGEPGLYGALPGGGPVIPI
jgi:hypothetical protein